jgi:hypothetical protein
MTGYAAHRFSHFLPSAFVNRVMRRISMRIERFSRSTCEVFIPSLNF